MQSIKKYVIKQMYYTSVECRQACSQREKSISYFQKEVEPDFFMYFCSLAEKKCCDMLQFDF